MKDLFLRIINLEKNQNPTYYNCIKFLYNQIYEEFILTKIIN
jgi:hypothetical protein